MRDGLRDWISVLLLLALMMLLCAGCFSSPVFKKVPRKPLPKESFKSEEHTRKAVQMFVVFFKSIKDHPEMLDLASALSAKVGIPTATIKLSKKAVEKIAVKLKEDKKKMREAQKKWEEDFDKYDEYSQGKMSFADKAKRSFWILVIIVILLSIFCPGAIIWLIRFLKKKTQKAKEAYVEEFKEELKFKDKLGKQTIKAVNKIKDFSSELWGKIEPFFKQEQDREIQDYIKKNNKK